MVHDGVSTTSDSPNVSLAGERDGDEPRHRKSKMIRILFMTSGDGNCVNAQSLNAREVAQRLDPNRFQLTFFSNGEPDSRLGDRPNTRFVKLPSRMQTLTVLWQMLCGHDLIAYLDLSPASNLYVQLPRILRRAKTVLHVEAVSFGHQLSPVMARYWKNIVRRVDVRTGITPFVVEDTERADNVRLHATLPVGVDTSRFAAEPEFRGDRINVVFVGSFTRRKRPDVVLEAADRFPQVQFHLVGEGQGDFYAQQLYEQLRRREGTNTLLHGALSQLKLSQLLQQCDVLLLPSRAEGLPKVTLEAAASCVPSIVFKDYHTPSVVDGKTGFQVTSDEQLFQRLDQLINDRALREGMGASGRQLAERYDWDVVALEWQRLYAAVAMGQQMESSHPDEQQPASSSATDARHRLAENTLPT